MSLAIKETADERKLKLRNSEVKACGAQLSGRRIGSCFVYVCLIKALLPERQSSHIVGAQQMFIQEMDGWMNEWI